ncbi:MAG TPA: hypothetical protein VGH87_15200 [Polyangiaceae bacterium]|jgi:hypothetical protein
MRSFALASTLLLPGVMAACAVGTNGSGDTTPGDDAGQAKDSAPFTQKDSSPPPPQQDSGTNQNDDAQPPPPQDSGTNTACTFSGTLVTYDFTGEPGNQTSTKATSSATNVTAGAISRATSLTASSGVDSINSSNWTTASKLDTTRYYTFTLTPQSSCTLDVTKLSITTKTSSTGPVNGSIATSDDGFAATTSFTPNTTATASLSVNGATGAVEVRVYGFGASGVGGTMRVDTTLTVSGALN